jgi:hypothetical protein
MLAFANEPNAGLEDQVVTTEGYVIGVYQFKAAACEPPTVHFRVWLAVRPPHGMKSVVGRHRAIVATVSAEVLREQLGSPRALTNLLGRRVRVTGQLTHNTRRRVRLTRGQGSYWELRGVSEIVACSRSACGTAAVSRPAPG